MPTLLFIVGVWLLCKGIRALFKPRRRTADPDPLYYSDDTKRFYADIEDMIEKYRAESKTKIAVDADIVPKTTADSKEILVAGIDRQCLNEQLAFINGQLASETNPDKTFKWMKEKQKVMKALAILNENLPDL